MTSLFCCLREGAAGAVRPYPCPSLLRGIWPPDTGKGRGDAGTLCRTRYGHRSRGCVTMFSALERAGILLGWRGSFRIFAARTALWPRPPFWAMALCCIPLPSTPGNVSPFLHSSVHCGDLWKDARKQKRPPARSRWPLISRREAAAYSPATAFWCSAMTLSATGWGASS